MCQLRQTCSASLLGAGLRSGARASARHKDGLRLGRLGRLGGHLVVLWEVSNELVRGLGKVGRCEGRLGQRSAGGKGTN
jgi:hypothetical protein